MKNVERVLSVALVALALVALPVLAAANPDTDIQAPLTSERTDTLAPGAGAAR